MNKREFTVKEAREFNAFWLSLTDRGFRSADCAAAVEPGRFSTRWIRGVGYVVSWKEFA